MEETIEKELINRIVQKRPYEKSFINMVSAFEKQFSVFDPVKNNFPIDQYFLNGKGNAKKKLVKENKIDTEWLREYKTKSGKNKNDFQGLYVFLCANVPFYVGISKGVIGRIDQHLNGRSHHTSTLAYNIGIIRHELITGAKYPGTRRAFDFATAVEPAKQFLRKQQLAWIHIENPEELYLFEIFCSMKLQCWLNRFETH